MPNNTRQVVSPVDLSRDQTPLGRAYRALSGRCIDCRGTGKRQNTTKRTVQCETCEGTGRLSSMSIAQVANAAGLTISTTIDALRALADNGNADVRSSSTGADQWQQRRSA